MQEDPPWLRIARFELGTAEVDGPKSNARIDRYHSATRQSRAVDDSVPWCSSFACWCMEQVGIASTRSKSARSWLEWGQPLTEPQLGCVVVLWRRSKDSVNGHVGFFLGKDENGRVLLLGGNQGNRVSIRPYITSRVLSYRWPSP